MCDRGEVLLSKCWWDPCLVSWLSLVFFFGTRGWREVDQSCGGITQSVNSASGVSTLYCSRNVSECGVRGWLSFRYLSLICQWARWAILKMHDSFFLLLSPVFALRSRRKKSAERNRETDRGREFRIAAALHFSLTLTAGVT